MLYYSQLTQLTRGKHEKCQSIVAKGAAAGIAFVGIGLPGRCMDWVVLDFKRHMDSL